MALKPTFLAFSDAPADFTAMIRPHATSELAPGVFVIEGDHARAIVAQIAQQIGATAHLVPVNLAEVETVK